MPGGLAMSVDRGRPEVITVKRARLTLSGPSTRPSLCVKDRDAPLTEMIATKIIKIAQTGVHDPAQLSALAIKTNGPMSALRHVM
jgi:hypothetical protein